MHFLLIVLTLCLSPAWASWPLVERESESSLASPKRLENFKKRGDRQELGLSMESNGLLEKLWDGALTANGLIKELKSLPRLRDKINDCLSDTSCEVNVVKDAVLYMRSKNYIDDVAGLILLAHVNQNRKQVAWLVKRKLDLPAYLLTLKSVSHSREVREAKSEKSILTKRKLRKKVKPWGKISPRQELFLKYDLFEIKVLTKILEQTEKRLLAHSAAVSFDYDGDGVAEESLELSSGGRYYVAQSLLDREIREETQSQGFLPGKTVTKPQLLAAALEMGHMSDEVLKDFMGLPEFKEKKGEKGKLYANALWSIAKTGLMAIPGGIYFVLPVVMIESYFQGKKANESKNINPLF